MAHAQAPPCTSNTLRKHRGNAHDSPSIATLRTEACA